MVANEVVDSILKSNKGVLLCKLDIEKTCDHVNWSFLCLVMKRMGFGGKRIRWIKWCISMATFSVLFNGTLTGFFRSSRGLKQERPLLSLLILDGYGRF